WTQGSLTRAVHPRRPLYAWRGCSPGAPLPVWLDRSDGVITSDSCGRNSSVREKEWREIAQESSRPGPARSVAPRQGRLLGRAGAPRGPGRRLAGQAAAPGLGPGASLRRPTLRGRVRRRAAPSGRPEPEHAEGPPRICGTALPEQRTAVGSGARGTRAGDHLTV